MTWTAVGEWLKSNGVAGASLAGSLLTGNLPGVVAAGVALISSATGTADPAKALTALQTDPATMLRLRELAVQEEASIREHLRATEEMRLKDAQAEHEQQQLTIRGGDAASDPYVSHTRPLVARQSWYITAAYVVGFEALKAAKLIDSGASFELAALLMAPVGAYLGFRSFDKLSKKGAAAK